jgi:hypothetical protein
MIDTSDHMRFTLYTRPNAVVCYAASLLEAGRSESVSIDLLSTKLACYWLSVSRSPSVKADRAESNRTLTRLTDESRAALVSDAMDRDADGYGRSLVILGCDPDHPVLPGEPAALHSSLAAFASQETGPVRFVISQVGDSPDEQIFVPHSPVESVRELLRRWGLDGAGAVEVRPYEKLRTARLEALIDPISRYAFAE